MNNISPDSISIIHRNFVQYGANAKEWIRKCVLLLPEIEKYRVWEQKGFGSIYEYAAKLAGMSQNTVDDALRILKKIEDKPALKQVVEEKGINAIRPVVAIATLETEGFWAEKAKEMSKNTLEVYVKDWRTSTAKITKNPHQQAIGNSGGESLRQKKIVIMELNPGIAEQLQKLKGQGDWNSLMQEFLRMRKAQMEAQKPAPIETESRHIPAKIKKHVIARTNSTCSFPHCTHPSEIFHHTQRFSLKHVHDPDQIEPLCKAHERLAHLGLIENEELPTNSWQVRKESDKSDAKYKVDVLVGKYRKFVPLNTTYADAWW